MTHLPEEDRPDGCGMTPVGDEEAFIAAMGISGLDGPVAVALAFAAAVQIRDVQSLEFARLVVTEESAATWGDFSSAGHLLDGAALLTQPQFPAPGMAYVRFTPDTGQSYELGGVMLPERTTVTLAWRPGSWSGWQVHAVGDPVLPEHLPVLP